MREYEKISLYWKVEKLTDFENVEIYARTKDIKFLIPLGCEAEIIGIQIISVSSNNPLTSIDWRYIHCLQPSSRGHGIIQVVKPKNLILFISI